MRPLTKHIASICMQSGSVLRVRLQVDECVLRHTAEYAAVGVWALDSQEKSLTCDLSSRSWPDDYSTVFSNVSENEYRWVGRALWRERLYYIIVNNSFHFIFFVNILLHVVSQADLATILPV